MRILFVCVSGNGGKCQEGSFITFSPQRGQTQHDCLYHELRDSSRGSARVFQGLSKATGVFNEGFPFLAGAKGTSALALCA